MPRCLFGSWKSGPGAQTCQDQTPNIKLVAKGFGADAIVQVQDVRTKRTGFWETSGFKKQMEGRALVGGPAGRGSWIGAQKSCCRPEGGP